MQKIIIQKVSENMADATVGTWFVQEGDKVSKGDLVVELITEKATFEIEAEEDGVLLRQFASSKSILPIGYVVAVIGAETGDIPPEIEEKNKNLLQALNIQLTDPLSSAKPSSSSASVKATPAARRKAKSLNIDLSAVQSSLGTTTVISEKDVNEYLDRQK
ncbi:biotin/lipoyl-containing protein [Planctomycetota bacterium]